MAEQPGNQTPDTESGAEVRERPVEEQRREPETAGRPGIADVATDPVREVITIPGESAENGVAGEADATDTDADTDAGSVPAAGSGTTDVGAADAADASSVGAADTGVGEVGAGDRDVDSAATGEPETDTGDTADTPDTGSVDAVNAGSVGAGATSDDAGDQAGAAASSDSEQVGAGPDDGHLRIGEETSSSIKYSQEITSPEDEPERAGRSLATTHHEVIKQWAEERGGTPATVEGTEHGDHLGVLRFDFGGKNENLRQVSWDEWFHTFDARRLNFIYQEQRRDGNQSNFFRLESPDREDA